MNRASDANRYLNAQPKLTLACKRCGGKGLITLPQLARLLYCNGCRVYFRVERAGLVEVLPSKDEIIKVAVRTSSSEWREHRAVLRERPNFRKRLRTAAIDFVSKGWGRWVIASSLALILLIAYFNGTAAPAFIATTPALPTTLEDRATLWATSLYTGDTATLTSLTDPALHRALRIWLAHGAGLPEPADAQTLATAPVLKIVANPRDATRVNISTKLSQVGGQTLTVQAEWVQIGNAWYFRPPKLRSVLPSTKKR